MKIKILAFCLINIFLLTSNPIVIATVRNNPKIAFNNNEGNEWNKDNDIRINVWGLNYLNVLVENRNESRHQKGYMTIELIYKENKLFFKTYDFEFNHTCGVGTTFPNLNFSSPVIGKLLVAFNFEGDALGLYESINLLVLMFKNNFITFGRTSW